MIDANAPSAILATTADLLPGKAAALPAGMAPGAVLALSVALLPGAAAGQDVTRQGRT